MKVSIKGVTFVLLFFVSVVVYYNVILFSSVTVFFISASLQRAYIDATSFIWYTYAVVSKSFPVRQDTRFCQDLVKYYQDLLLRS